MCCAGRLHDWHVPGKLQSTDRVFAFFSSLCLPKPVSKKGTAFNKGQMTPTASGVISSLPTVSGGCEASAIPFGNHDRASASAYFAFLLGSVAIPSADITSPQNVIWC